MGEHKRFSHFFSRKDLGFFKKNVFLQPQILLRSSNG